MGLDPFSVNMLRSSQHFNLKPPVGGNHSRARWMGGLGLGLVGVGLGWVGVGWVGAWVLKDCTWKICSLSYSSFRRR